MKLSVLGNGHMNFPRQKGRSDQIPLVRGKIGNNGKENKGIANHLHGLFSRGNPKNRGLLLIGTDGICILPMITV